MTFLHTILLFACFFGLVAGGAVPTKLETVYTNLNAKVGLQNITLKVSKDKSINGDALGRTITVTTGALALPIDDLAFIVGHEMSHVLYGPNELNADIHSIQILQNSGKYDACKGGVDLFKRFLKTNGEQGGADDPHPKNSVRIANVKKLAC